MALENICMFVPGLVRCSSALCLFRFVFLSRFLVYGKLKLNLDPLQIIFENPCYLLLYFYTKSVRMSPKIWLMTHMHINIYTKHRYIFYSNFHDRWLAYSKAVTPNSCNREHWFRMIIHPITPYGVLFWKG